MEVVCPVLSLITTSISSLLIPYEFLLYMSLLLLWDPLGSEKGLVSLRTFLFLPTRPGRKRTGRQGGGTTPNPVGIPTARRQGHGTDG
jgi:hypothetical protein